MKTAFPEPGAGVKAAGSLAFHPHEILVPLDFSEGSLTSLQYAASLAEQTGARITLLHVLPHPICVSDFPYPGPGGKDGFEAIDDLLRDLRLHGIPADVRAKTLVRGGPVVEGILDVGREIHADLIVTTTRGVRGFGRFLRRGVAEKVARRAPCPVLLVRPVRDA